MSIVPGTAWPEAEGMFAGVLLKPKVRVCTDASDTRWELDTDFRALTAVFIPKHVQFDILDILNKDVL